MLPRVMLLLLGAQVVQGRTATAKARDREKSLHAIALEEGCTKATHQQFTLTYPTWLEHWRDRHFEFLEVGVGSTKTPSIKMWKRYFAHANVFGADAWISGPRIIKASQNSGADLHRLALYRNWSVVVEDASHGVML